MVEYDEMIEELYVTTLENLKQMRNIIIKKAEEDTTKYDEIIEHLNDQYNYCKDELDKLYGYK